MMLRQWEAVDVANMLREVEMIVLANSRDNEFSKQLLEVLLMVKSLACYRLLLEDRDSCCIEGAAVRP